MRYEKPQVLELGARTQRAQGQGPLACISGPAAGGAYENCSTGTGAAWSCQTGESGGTAPLCVGGSAVGSGGDCFSGPDVGFWCGVGTGGASSPYGCNVGPSFV